jgi:D-serine deaminase-like pyridoxal phosphate-dependent protein
MTSRRHFLMTAAASSALATRRMRAAKTSGDAFPYTELETRIAKRDFRDLTKDVLPTPCMVIDLAVFEQNMKRMTDQVKSTGINLRPHCKIHKSVDIARRQMNMGAIGITCATIAEAELMSNAGIRNVLWTQQPASINNVARAVALSKKDPTFMFVVDSPVVLEWVEQAAAANDARLRIAVSVYAGMDRQGIDNGQPAVELAQKVAQSKRASFEGLMAYSGTAAHTHGWDKRCARSASDLAGAGETAALCRKSGLPVNIVSGGSTGTYNIDHQNGLTELEAGSYVFMDTGYAQIGSKSGDATYSDFGTSLTILTTVTSRNHPNLVTTDYGNKANAKPTDKVKGKPWLQVTNQGAEYGGLKWNAGDPGPELKLGDRVEIICTNLDTSTNNFDRYYVADGDRIVDVWPIMGRAGAAQR